MVKIFKYLSNLKLAIFLLLLIAFFSGLGSVIDQDKPLDFYMKNYSSLIFNIPLWTIFKVCCLDHIYSAWWFFFLLLIFGICLLSCTLSQQFPALKFARRYYFYTTASQFNKLDFYTVAASPIESQVCYKLIQEEYSIFQKHSSFYSYKGLIGRLGPVIVHLSIITILIGSILSAFQGFNTQEFIPKSEIFHLQNIIKSGTFSTIPAQSFRVNDFWVHYKTNGLIKQFQSDLSVLNGKGEELQQKTISVNKPLIYKNLTIYQTDWGIIGLRLQLTNRNSIIQLPMSRILSSSQKLWVSWLPLNIKEKKGVVLILSNARGKIDYYDETNQIVKKLSLSESIQILDFLYVKVIEFICSTGIQVKQDPGLLIIYTGFAFLILSSFISYISFSEIWFLIMNHQVLFGGKTNRAKGRFLLEVAKLKKSL